MNEHEQMTTTISAIDMEYDSYLCRERTSQVTKKQLIERFRKLVKEIKLSLNQFVIVTKLD